MPQSQASEVLLLRVVTDLVADTALRCTERGSFELKGLPGRGICLRRACRFRMMSSLGPIASLRSNAAFGHFRSEAGI